MASGPVTNGDVPHQTQNELLQQFEESKAQRVNPLGASQYIELESSANDRFEALAGDLWVDHTALNAQIPTLKNGDEVKFLIIGGGFGGLLYGARLVEAGFRADDIRLIDNAGGFGGTWYWNRYPGLMCDNESSVYAPLLEETNYVPKHRYAYGPELRQHAERISHKYGLVGFFRTIVQSSTWDDQSRRWEIKLQENRGPGIEPIQLAVRAQFLIAANGFLNHPKVPKLRGLETFQGTMFHTARWNYDATGGMPEDPSLTLLKDKKVGIIGTGATGIQVVPELAKWVKELYVFQRTPSSVDARGQCEINAQEWNSNVATHKGWQYDRCDNFLEWSVGLNPGKDLVNDGWTLDSPSYVGFMGMPHEKPLKPEEIPEHIKYLLANEKATGERKRRRIAETVKDPATAKALTPWYPTWCKRPCYHDDYLPAFNLPQVHLVDTMPSGIEYATTKGLVVNGEQYDLDVLIFSTGFRAPATASMEPGAQGNMTFTGRDSLKLSEKWATKGASTLHSFLTHGFPNLLLGGYTQIGNGQHGTYIMDMKAKHMAYILSEAHKRAGDGDTKRLTVEGSEGAEEAWSQEIVKYATWWGALSICTPGFATNEGDMFKPVSPEDALRNARAAPHGGGLVVFRDTIKHWREDGKMDGVILSS